MSREFVPALRELDRRLSVPLPERVRILRELESGLEQLRTRLVAGGLSAESAAGALIPALASLVWFGPQLRRRLLAVRVGEASGAGVST